MTELISLVNLALHNKDFFTTLILLGVMMGFAYIATKISKKNNESIQSLALSITYSMNEGFKQISLLHGKTIVEDRNILIKMCEKVMLSTTTQKLNFLRKRLEQNDIQNNRTEIEKHIRTQLINFSQLGYIDFLNSFISEVGPIGDWVEENFPMERFLEEVYKIFFSDKFSVDRKIELIENTMIAFQATMWSEFRLALKK